MEGRYLQAADRAGLQTEATQAAAEGAAAVILSEGAVGDPFVLAAGLGSVAPDLLLCARIGWSPEGRHPAMLAREVTCLDLICGGRSVLCFAPPFAGALAEVVSLCRALWRSGEVDSAGPHFPVQAASNRSRPTGEGSPLIGFDLTAGDDLPEFLVGAADLLFLPTSDPAVCRLERV